MRFDPFDWLALKCFVLLSNAIESRCHSYRSVCLLLDLGSNRFFCGTAIAELPHCQTLITEQPILPHEIQWRDSAGVNFGKLTNRIQANFVLQWIEQSQRIAAWINSPLAFVVLGLDFADLRHCSG